MGEQEYDTYADINYIGCPGLYYLSLYRNSNEEVIEHHRVPRHFDKSAHICYLIHLQYHG